MYFRKTTEKNTFFCHFYNSPEYKKFNIFLRKKWFKNKLTGDRIFNQL